jgi:hypothetical protein
MTTKLASSSIPSAPEVTFLSLNTRQVARCIAPLPDPHTRRQITRIIQAGAGDIPDLSRFHVRLHQTQGSVQFTFGRGQTELFTALLAWNRSDSEIARLRSWLSQLRRPARSRHWPPAGIPALNPEAVPWVATLYQPEVERLALHEAVALVRFQQSLVAVLLSESTWSRGAASSRN